MPFVWTSQSRKQEVFGGTGHERPVKVAEEQVRSSLDTFPKAFIAKGRLFFAVFVRSLLPYFFILGTKQRRLIPAPLQAL